MYGKNHELNIILNGFFFSKTLQTDHIEMKRSMALVYVIKAYFI